MRNNRLLRKNLALLLSFALLFTGIPMNFVVAQPAPVPAAPSGGPVPDPAPPSTPGTPGIPGIPVTPPTGPVTPPTGPVAPPTGPVTPPTGPVAPPTGPVAPPTGPVTPPTVEMGIITVNIVGEGSVVVASDPTGANVIATAGTGTQAIQLPAGMPIFFIPSTGFSNWDSTAGLVPARSADQSYPNAYFFPPIPPTPPVGGIPTVQFTAVFKTEYELNLQADAALYAGAFDLANKGYLRVKHYGIRTTNDGQSNVMNYSPWGDMDVTLQKARDTMFGKARYVGSRLLKPAEGLNEFGNIPKNTTFNMDNQSAGLYWYNDNYSAAPDSGAYQQATKYQGFFVPKLKGEHTYKIRVASDDGAYGTIAIAGEQKLIASKWKYKHSNEAQDSVEFKSLSGKIYPISIDYFENFMTDAAFALEMSVDGGDYQLIPADCLYPVTEGVFKGVTVEQIQITNPTGVIEGTFDKVEGTAELNTIVSVEVYSGDVKVKEGTATVDKDGKWSLSLIGEGGVLPAFDSETVKIRAKYSNIDNLVVEGKDYVEKVVTYPFNFSITVDDHYKIFVNGKSVDRAGKAMGNAMKWTTVDRYRLPLGSGENVIVVQTKDVGWIGGFISQLKYKDENNIERVVKTGDANTWKVKVAGSNDEVDYTQEDQAAKLKTKDFDATGWKDPQIYTSLADGWVPEANHGGAKWVWSTAAVFGDENKTVFFRLVVGEDTERVAKGVVLKKYESTPTGDVLLTGDAAVPKTGTRIIKLKPTLIDQYGHEMDEVTYASEYAKIKISNLKVDSTGNEDPSAKLFKNAVVSGNSLVVTLKPETELAHGVKYQEDTYQWVAANVKYRGSYANVESMAKVKLTKEMSVENSFGWVKLNEGKESEFLTTPYTFVVTPNDQIQKFKVYALDQFGQKMRGEQFKKVIGYNGSDLTGIETGVTYTPNKPNVNKDRAELTVKGSILPAERNFVEFKVGNNTSELSDETFKVVFKREDSVASKVTLVANDGTTVLENNAAVDVPKMNQPEVNITYSVEVRDQFGDILTGPTFPVKNAAGVIEQKELQLSATPERTEYDPTSRTLKLTPVSVGSVDGIEFKVEANIEGAVLSTDSQNAVTLKIKKELPVATAFAIEGSSALDVPTKEEGTRTATYKIVNATDQYGQALTAEHIAKAKFNYSNPLPAYLEKKAGVVTLKPATEKGTFKVWAKLDGVTSTKLNVVVSKADPLATEIEIAGPMSIDVPKVGEPVPRKTPYNAYVLDQFGAIMKTDSGIIPANLKREGDLPEKVSFTSDEIVLTKASMGGNVTLVATYKVNSELTLEAKKVVTIVREEPVIQKIVIHGKEKHEIPAFGAADLTAEYKAIGTDQYGVKTDIEIVSNYKNFDNGVLTVKAAMKARTVVLKASAGELEVTKTVQLVRAKAVPTSLEWTGKDKLTVLPNKVQQSNYAALVLDQYRSPFTQGDGKVYAKIAIKEQTPENGVTFAKGNLFVPSKAKIGTVTLVGTLKGITLEQSEKVVTLERRVQVASQVLISRVDDKDTNPSTDLLHIPTSKDVATIAKYKAMVLDQYGDEMSVGSTKIMLDKLVDEEMMGGIMQVTSTDKPFVVNVFAEYRNGSDVKLSAPITVTVDYEPSKPLLKLTGKTPIAIAHGASATERYNYTITDQYGRDLTNSLETPVTFTAAGWLNGQRIPLQTGLTFRVEREVETNRRILVLDAASNLAAGTYEVALDGMIFEIPDASARKAKVVSDDIVAPTLPARPPMLNVVPTLIVKITKAPAPVVPPVITPVTPGGDRDRAAATEPFIETLFDDPLALSGLKYTQPYMNGYPGKVFMPQKAMTRAEMASVFVKIMQLSAMKPSTSSYSDVSKSAWYSASVHAAVKAGIMSADGKNFRPNDAITRAELADAFAKYWELRSVKVNDKETKATDVKGHKSEKAINKVINTGLFELYEDGTFRPNSATTRDQIARIVNKVIAREGLSNKNASYKDVGKDYWAFLDIEAATNRSSGTAQ